MARLSPIAYAFLLAAVAYPTAAQWSNRYPTVDGFSHQLYLEQENLPILSSGPINPAPSPDGVRLAFSHQGWIWVLDLNSGIARRLTDGPAVDGRPRWSPDGRHLAFVRDSGTDTSIVTRHVDSGTESTIDSPAIELDPEFTRDGNALYYTSARTGRLAIWKRDLATGTDEKLIEGDRLSRAARALADGGLVYHSMDYPSYGLRLREADGATDRLLFEQGWMAHFDPDVHPHGRSMVYGVGDGNDLRLSVMDVDRTGFPRWLTAAGGRALHPAFSSDGETIYFVEADARQQFSLLQVNAAGGEPERLAIDKWEYGSPLGDLFIATIAEHGGSVPARISVARIDGHPVASPQGPTFVDIQNGDTYFYSKGRIELRLPEGQYRIVATRGPFSVPAESLVRVRGGRSVDRVLAIAEIWNARRAGYLSADHHVHLNASGVNELDLADLLLPMRGEALDYAAPMAWNQYNRFIDAGRIGQRQSAADGTTAMLSQEVRSDFHGHVGMIGLQKAFHPWFFGPTEPVYANRDLNNGQAIAFAGSQGALATYVHPVARHEDPFADLSANPPPHELILDGVLVPGVGLELVCQWTSPLGTAEVWYRFLNIGRAMPATSGTDMMANFYRTPAIGSARSYVPVIDDARGFDSVVEQVRRGRGFVSTGPALLFQVDGSTPGETVAAGPRSWTLELVSMRPVEKLEIVVNGRVVRSLDGFQGKGSRTYHGSADLPEGGWIAARAVGGKTGWPTMAGFHFAHTTPIWIDRIGSTDPLAARSAAKDLLAALAFSESSFVDKYEGNVPGDLGARIRKARKELEAIAE